MANLSSLYSSVRLYAQQCPDATIDKFLIEAVREFCRESWYYQQTEFINQVVDTASYTLVPANGAEIISVESVEQDENYLLPLTERDATGPNGNVTGFRFEPPNTITIYPTPTESITNGLEVREVIMPPENTTTIPDSVYRNFKETIAAGALANILMIQNEAWTNPELATEKLRQFIIGINKAKGDRKRDFRPGPIRVRPISFTLRRF